MKKAFYIIIGLICVVLGVMGIFLPLLPTTPFLLLASYLFLKSSDRLYNWLMDHPVLGLYVKSYLKYRGVERKYKIIAISTLWLTMGISIYLVDIWPVRALLVLIGLGVTIHLLKLRSLTREEILELEEMENNLRNNVEKNGIET